MATLGEDVKALSKVNTTKHQKPLLRRVFRNTRPLRAIQEFFDLHPNDLPKHALYVDALITDIDLLRNAKTLKETRLQAKTFHPDLVAIRNMIISLMEQDTYLELKKIALQAHSDGYLTE